MNTLTPEQIIQTLTAKQVLVQLKAGNLSVKAAKGILTPTLVALIRDNKAALISYLDMLAQSTVDDKDRTIVAIERNDGEHLPLSFSQQRLWFIDQYQKGDSSNYNMPVALTIEGEFSPETAQRALATIIERHEVIRCVFRIAGGEAGQQTRAFSAIDFSLTLVDVADLSQQQQQQQIDSIIALDAQKPFDLGNDLMLRASFIRQNASRGVLLFNTHHIASDGWSMGLLVKEFSTLYQAYGQGRANPLPPLPVQYADYARWQHQWLRGEVLDKQLDYWRKQLSGLPMVHSLVLDKPRPGVQTFAGALHHSRVDAPTHAALGRLCQDHGASLFMGLHGVFSVLLSRYSNETDIVVGSPIANREQAEVAGLIGFFVNTLVLRSDLSGQPDFITLLKQSKALLLGAYKHQQVPFERLVEQLQPQRSLAHSPLFQVMLILQNNEAQVLQLPGLTLSPLAQSEVVAKYDLTLNIYPDSEGELVLEWEYNRDLFGAATITRMAAHFNRLLAALLASPEQNVFAVPMLDKAEQQQLLYGLNDTAFDYDRELCIHQWLEQHARQQPDAIALVYGGADSGDVAQSLTYAELNRRSNQLAHYLLEQRLLEQRLLEQRLLEQRLLEPQLLEQRLLEQRQLKPDTLVGVCAERSLDMLIALIAIHKAGAAYVPLDPAYPAARLDYMIKDAGLTTVLTQVRLRGKIPLTEAQAVYLDDSEWRAKLAAYPVTDISLSQSGLSARNLAYLIYTSGSTGHPKGVMIEHQNVVALIAWALNTFDREQLSAVCASTSMCFDLSVFEFFAPLAAGGTVYMVDNLLGLAQQTFAKDITLINTVPSTADTLIAAQSQFAALDTVVFCGEPLKQPVVDELYLHGAKRVYDLYGPSEDTVYSTCALRVHHGTANIGRAIDNSQAYILNAARQLVPHGVNGELYLGGHGLSRGYYHRDDLTAGVFIDNPFYDPDNANSSPRLYKSGDLVRWRSVGDDNSELVYLSRIDNQVKVRGFRIELGEIEYHLQAHSEVADAVVLAKDSPSGDKALVAYVVTADSERLNTKAQQNIQQRQQFTEGLREALSINLSDYMVPTVFVLLDKLPLTPNGKVDRRALPEPDISRQQAVYTAPGNEHEQAWCEIWQQVLGVEQVGINDNFFELGGHSLSATRVAAQMGRRLDIEVPLNLLFTYQTIATLAPQLVQLQLGAALRRPPLTQTGRDGELISSFAQQRLWLLDRIDGSSIHYNIPGALKLSGSLNLDALQRAFDTIVARHESLRTVFVKGSDGNPVQLIKAAAPLHIALTDLSSLDASSLNEKQQQDELSQLLAQNARKPFDLASDVMLQLMVVKLAADEHVVAFNMHHIASDGWSMGILVREFSALYAAYVQGRDNPLAPLALQYADYARWQRDWLQGEVLQRQLNYWTAQLAGLPTVHSLVPDKPRPPRQSFNGRHYHSTVAAPLTEQLQQLCRSTQATLFMGVQAAFAVLLSRYSNETDIVMGSPVANREQDEVAGLIGFFVNNLVLRSDLSEDPDFNALIAQSKAMLLAAYQHQQVPFEQLVEQLQPQRNPAHSPLFQVMLVLHNNDDGTLALPGLSLAAVENTTATAKFDLTLNVMEGEQGLELVWEYNSDLFAAATIAQMAGHFGCLLTALVATPQQPVSAAAMFDQAGQQQLLSEFNETAAAYPLDLCIHQLFEQQVEKLGKTQPDAVALVFEGQQLSYAELNRRANQLARYLIEQRQVKADTLVGICAERSLEMVVAIFAIFKAGGAYVPLDPELPRARLHYMIDDAGLGTVLTQSHLLEKLPGETGKTICLDDAAQLAKLDGYGTDNIPPSQLSLTSRDLAYMIYTSGSTGQPKGVMVEHQALVNRIHWMDGEYGTSVDDRILQKTPFSFDVSVWEFVWPLIGGARMIVAKPGGHKDPAYLSQLIREQGVTKCHFVPSMLSPMLLFGELEHCTSLQQVFCSGEALALQQVSDFYARLPLAQLHNLYGPTEAAIDVSYWDCSQPAGSSVPIGRPIQNVQLLVLDTHCRPCPRGVVGELHIGGAALARGYLNRDDLTAAKFIVNRYHQANQANSPERLYKTGDLVRQLANGSIEYLGRIDHQVKIRGLRIELGEIESVLKQHPQVADCVVSVHRQAQAQGDERMDLVAYYVAVEGAGKITNESLRRLLSEDLPDYMIPAIYMPLEAFALTTSGKKDLKKLPKPTVSREQLATRFVAPGNELEQFIVAEICRLIGLERVGIDDNFFEMGATSLDIVKLADTLSGHLRRKVAAVELFNFTNVRRLAENLGDQSADAQLAEQQSAQRTEKLSKAKSRLKNRAKRKSKNV